VTSLYGLGLRCALLAGPAAFLEWLQLFISANHRRPRVRRMQGLRVRLQLFSLQGPTPIFTSSVEPPPPFLINTEPRVIRVEWNESCACRALCCITQKARSFVHITCHRFLFAAPYCNLNDNHHFLRLHPRAVGGNKI
jgi:hypothetical protein